MKKTILTFAAISALGVAAYASQDGLSATVTVGWESEYVFRGLQLADSSVQPAVDINYMGYYAGVWASFPIVANQTFSKEFDFYAGYGMDLSETVNLDLGVTEYYYPSAHDISKDIYKSTTEVYVGFSFDVISTPSIYLYYDWRLKDFTVEGHVGHSFEVAEQVSFDVGASLGWVANDKETKTVEGPDYLYGSATVDLVYKLAENAKAYAGPRISFNDYDNITNESNLWWGVGITAGF